SIPTRRSSDLHRLGQTAVKGFLSHPEKPLRRFGNAPDGISPRRVPVIALILGADIDADDVPLAQHAVPGNAVNQFIIDRCADASRKTVIPLEGRNRSVLSNHPVGNPVQLLRSHAGSDRLLDFPVRLPDNPSRLSHALQFPGGFEYDHPLSPRISDKMERVTCSMGCSPSI